MLEKVIFGPWSIKPTTNQHSFPSLSTTSRDVHYADISCVYFCPFCLQYSYDGLPHADCSDSSMQPPSSDAQPLYEDGPIRIWSVDSRQEKFYCQSLSLLAKLFVQHKGVCFDVETFEFYVLTTTDFPSLPHAKNTKTQSSTTSRRKSPLRHMPVGFFSKERKSIDNFNLACILILPPFQGFQYGRLLIEFSYFLHSFQGHPPGSPERPLSPLGYKAYVKFWADRVMHVFNKSRTNRQMMLSVRDVAELAELDSIDVVDGVQYLIECQKMEVKEVLKRRGKHVELKLITDEQPKFVLDESKITMHK